MPTSSKESLIKIDPDIPLDLVAPLGCGLQTGAGTVLNELQPRLGSTLIVLGTGAVGAGAIMAARVANCAKVIAVDIHDSRLELAKELGATETINTRTEKLAQAIMALTDGRGADYIVDTTARPELLEQAVDALALRGALAIVGAAAPGTTANFEIGASLVKGWTLKMVIQGSSVPQVFIPRLIQLWRHGKFPFDKLIKHYDHDAINDGFADSKSGITVKPVIRY